MKTGKNIKKALKTCGYPAWAFERVEQQRAQKQLKEQSANTKQNEKEDKKVGMVILPYVEGLH